MVPPHFGHLMVWPPEADCVPGFFPDADFEAELLPFRRELPRSGGVGRP